ncbi:MAG: hypothetical protein CL917_19580 [Deltaproteobacteria bacterium]|nr:hypothetical protein [Deltaproteobacteria bacterium]
MALPRPDAPDSTSGIPPSLVSAAIPQEERLRGHSSARFSLESLNFSSHLYSFPPIHPSSHHSTLNTPNLRRIFLLDPA